MLIASHDMELLLRTCERVCVLAGGKVQALGATPEVLTRRTLLEHLGLHLPLGLEGRSAEELAALAGPATPR